MRFVPALQPPENPGKRQRWFVFQGDRLLVPRQRSGELRLYLDAVEQSRCPVSAVQFLGRLDGVSCFAAEVDAAAQLPAEIHTVGLRPLLGTADEEELAVAGRARQLVQWTRNHRFCGRCGGETRSKVEERARVCSFCEQTWYPRVSPAVIVAIVRDGHILLARSNRRPTGFYSVLAGFVEPGETLEDAVRREVREEVGIRLHNIRYFGSQPWPFPDALMVAFTAEHASGEISVEPSEILRAAWFRPDALPTVPGPYSIARRLIDWFVQAFGPSRPETQRRNTQTP
ncbi:MAG TPA: NAD(+) diphosphatase [Desulfobacterales bacterium]